MQKVSKAERPYIEESSTEALANWVKEQQKYKILLIKAENKWLFQRQNFF